MGHNPWIPIISIVATALIFGIGAFLSQWLPNWAAYSTPVVIEFAYFLWYAKKHEKDPP